MSSSTSIPEIRSSVILLLYTLQYMYSMTVGTDGGIDINRAYHAHTSQFKAITPEAIIASNEYSKSTRTVHQS